MEGGAGGVLISCVFVRTQSLSHRYNAGAGHVAFSPAKADVAVAEGVGGGDLGGLGGR